MVGAATIHHPRGGYRAVGGRYHHHSHLGVKTCRSDLSVMQNFLTACKLHASPQPLVKAEARFFTTALANKTQQHFMHLIKQL